MSQCKSCKWYRATDSESGECIDRLIQRRFPIVLHDESCGQWTESEDVPDGASS